MESRDIATNQIQIQKDRKKNVYQEVDSRKCLIRMFQFLTFSLLLIIHTKRGQLSIKLAGIQHLIDFQNLPIYHFHPNAFYQSIT